MGNVLRLTAVAAQAQAQGLSAGMTLADARARCPQLVTLVHDPAADAALLGRLAARMARFTPMVALDPPDGLICDITGCAHLFGGEARLVAMAVAEAGLAARHACAAHAATARALARHGGGEADVRRLPVAALELPEEALAGLRRAGLRSLGDLARRPMAGLAARFGETMVARLRAVLGETSQAMATAPPPAPVQAEAHFAEPLARTDDVLDVLESLLIAVAAQMEARQLGGRRFVVTLERSDGARRRLAVETGRALRDPATVLRLLRERIDSLADPLDPGFGFDAIRLAVPRTGPLVARQLGLESHAAPVGEDVAALIDRLATRLGPDSIRRLYPRDSHLPEAAQQGLPTRCAWPAAAACPPRPLFLLDPPQPITAIAAVPDGPPLRFRWRGRLHEVASAEGPERIAPEWWRRPRGHMPGHGLTRDYYRIEDSAGRRFWLLRHGLYAERGDPRWYVHGLFA